MLTAICPVPNGDHAGVNAVQDSKSQVGLLRPTPRLSDEGKARFFLAVQNGRCWPFSTVVAGSRFGRYRGKSRHGRMGPRTTQLTHLRHRSAFFAAVQNAAGSQGTPWSSTGHRQFELPDRWLARDYSRRPSGFKTIMAARLRGSGSGRNAPPPPGSCVGPYSRRHGHRGRNNIPVKVFASSVGGA